MKKLFMLSLALSFLISGYSQKRVFVPEINEFLKLKISTRMIRTIDKIGLTAALKKVGLSLNDIRG